MMLIPYRVAASAIEGVGLFSVGAVAKGAPIYEYDNRFVMIISLSEIEKMPAAAKEQTLKYSYRGTGKHRLSGAVYYCADDSRFFNHSDTPNVLWDNEKDLYYAAEDIVAGSELTCDYREFSEPGDWEMC